MKKVLCLFAVLLTVSTLTAQKQTIGYVNVQEIYQALPEAIKIDSDLKNLERESQPRLDSLVGVYQTAVAAYQKTEGSMTQEQLQAEQKKIIGLENTIQQYRQSIAVRMQEIQAPLNKKIKEAIEAVAQKENINFVFNKTDELPIMLYTDDKYDLTYKVIDVIKRGKK